MAKWTASQFGKPGAQVNGSDYKRTLTNTDSKGNATTSKAATDDSPAISNMANSLGTQSGQTNMGDSRATKS